MRWLWLVMVGGSRGPTRGRKGRLAISMVIPSNKGSDPVSRKLAPFFTLHSSQGKWNWEFIHASHCSNVLQGGWGSLITDAVENCKRKRFMRWQKNGNSWMNAPIRFLKSLRFVFLMLRLSSHVQKGSPALFWYNFLVSGSNFIFISVCPFLEFKHKWAQTKHNRAIILNNFEMYFTSFWELPRQKKWIETGSEIVSSILKVFSIKGVDLNFITICVNWYVRLHVATRRVEHVLLYSPVFLCCAKENERDCCTIRKPRIYKTVLQYSAIFFYVFKYFHVIGMKDKKAQIIFDFRFLGFIATQKLAAHSIDLLFSPQIPNSRMIHLCLPC